MNKLLIRLVALVLVSCLLLTHVDAHALIALPAPIHTPHASSEMFESQALAAAAVWMHFHPALPFHETVTALTPLAGAKLALFIPLMQSIAVARSEDDDIHRLERYWTAEDERKPAARLRATQQLLRAGPFELIARKNGLLRLGEVKNIPMIVFLPGVKEGDRVTVTPQLVDNTHIGKLNFELKTTPRGHDRPALWLTRWNHRKPLALEYRSTPGFSAWVIEHTFTKWSSDLVGPGPDASGEEFHRVLARLKSEGFEPLDIARPAGMTSEGVRYLAPNPSLRSRQRLSPVLKTLAATLPPPMATLTIALEEVTALGFQKKEIAKISGYLEILYEMGSSKRPLLEKHPVIRQAIWKAILVFQKRAGKVPTEENLMARIEFVRLQGHAYERMSEGIIDQSIFSMYRLRKLHLHAKDRAALWKRLNDLEPQETVQALNHQTRLDLTEVLVLGETAKSVAKRVGIYFLTLLNLLQGSPLFPATLEKLRGGLAPFQQRQRELWALNQIYRYPQAMADILGDSSRPMEERWALFIQELRRRQPAVAHDLEALEVQRVGILEGPLMLYRPSQKSVLLAGAKTADREALAAVLAGDFRKLPWVPNEDSPWELIGREKLFFVQAGEHVYAGPLLEPRGLSPQPLSEGAIQFPAQRMFYSLDTLAVIEEASGTPKTHSVIDASLQSLPTILLKARSRSSFYGYRDMASTLRGKMLLLWPESHLLYLKKKLPPQPRSKPLAIAKGHGWSLRYEKAVLSGGAKEIHRVATEIVPHEETWHYFTRRLLTALEKCPTNFNDARYIQALINFCVDTMVKDHAVVYSRGAKEARPATAAEMKALRDEINSWVVPFLARLVFMDLRELETGFFIDLIEEFVDSIEKSHRQYNRNILNGTKTGPLLIGTRTSA